MRRGQTTGVPAPVDVLVFAPHPDDEVIGTGGVLQQAVGRGERVRIVFVPNGGGYPRAASFLTRKPVSGLGRSDFVELATARQREAIDAAAVLGIRPSSLVFLGYPDGVLEQGYSIANGAPAHSPSTGRSATYGPVMAPSTRRLHRR